MNRKSIRLGIDYRPALFGGAGMGRYVRELCQALVPRLNKNDLALLYLKSSKKTPRAISIPQSDRFKLVTGFMPHRLLKLLFTLKIMSVESFTGNMDLFLYTDFVFPPLRRTPYAVMLYDLLFLKHQDLHPGDFTKRIKKEIANVLSKARGVITPSQAVLEDLNQYFPHIGAKKKVIPMGADHLLDIREKKKTAPFDSLNYFLCVGAIEPRKNHIKLLEAYEKASRDLDFPHLVVAGRKGWLNHAFKDRLGRSILKEKIHIVEDLDDRDLVRLYRRARALVYPSLGEGFGLPVVEAMSLNCPVIASTAPCLPETCAGAALLTDPRDTDKLSQALSRMAVDSKKREESIMAGAQRVKELTWERCAEETLAFLKEIV